MVPPTSASRQREPGSRTPLGSCCQLPRSCSLSLWPTAATEAAPSWGSLVLAMEDYPEGPGQQQSLLCKSCGLQVRLPRCTRRISRCWKRNVLSWTQNSCPTLPLLSVDQPCSPIGTKGVPQTRLQAWTRPIRPE